MLKYSIITCFIISLISCDQYLDVKPDQSLVVPTSVSDLQALLNNTDRMNASNPVVQDGATDNSYVIPATWQGLTDVTSKNMYIWGDDVFNNSDNNEWSMPYVMVFYANIVLEQLEKIDPAPLELDRMRGEALFFRSFAFYQLAQLFAKPYDSNTAQTDLGIPLRIHSNVSERSVRSSVQETYNQIIKDLELAGSFLPENSTYKTTPTKAAAFGLLARVLLSMENYKDAAVYADACLNYQNSLLDYNGLSLSVMYPFARFNDEVIYHSTCFGRTIMSITYGRVSQELYELYEENDLRKDAFFSDRSGTYSFRGSYDGSATLFNGIAVNEMYLVKAECAARNGHVDQALETINALLKKRYRNGFVPLAPDDPEELLNFILRERRKELPFRGLRWTDLRRLNRDERFAKSVYRDIDGKLFELKPNDSKYVLPIPNSVILNNSMEQNER